MIHLLHQLGFAVIMLAAGLIFVQKQNVEEVKVTAPLFI